MLGLWYTMQDGQAVLALEALNIKDLTVEDGEEVPFHAGISSFVVVVREASVEPLSCPTHKNA